MVFLKDILIKIEYNIDRNIRRTTKQLKNIQPPGSDGMHKENIWQQTINIIRKTT